MLTQYTEANLFSALSSPQCPVEEIKLHKSVLYITRYLDDLRKTQQDGKLSILVEEEYVDSDFMDDFSFYYVRCFRKYERNCKRLHFFLLPHDSEALVALSNGHFESKYEEIISKAYLGFVVARPLPYAVIGRTVLKTYPSDGGRRNYMSVRDYEVNVMGQPLVISKSLAFQEQDTVVAACASVALWAAFQKTSKLYHSLAPTTTAITSAANIIPSDSRTFPSKGLVIEQMVNAVKHVGLEPEVFKFTKNLPSISLMYGYLALGQPIILVFEVEGQGLHAVTVSGYSMLPTPQKNTEVDQTPNTRSIPMMGLNINELYAHDDGYGAFCRFPVLGAGDGLTFTGEWENDGSPLALKPNLLIIPIHKKIRVTFEDVYQWLVVINHIIFTISGLDKKVNSHQWDLRLVTSNQYKTEVLKSSEYEAAQKSVILTKGMPRFVWLAKLRFSSRCVYELIFDATDLGRGVPLFSSLWHDETLRTRFGEKIRVPKTKAMFENGASGYFTFMNFIADGTNTPTPHFFK